MSDVLHLRVAESDGIFMAHLCIVRCVYMQLHRILFSFTKQLLCVSYHENVILYSGMMNNIMSLKIKI